MSDQTLLMAASGLQRAANEPIFFSETGNPRLFFIERNDPNRDKVAEEIRKHGGIVESDRTGMMQEMVHLSTFPWPEHTTYQIDFVFDSINKGSQMPLENYVHRLQKRALQPYNGALVGPEESLGSGRKKLKKSTTKFTPEADKFILEQVRLKPRLRTSHKFFEDLAQHEMLKGHTGNSVRSRYRAHLEHKLGYVYQTDAHGNVLIGSDGKPEIMDASQAPTIKNKFTAEEDYALCSDIIEHVKLNQGPSVLGDENKFSVSISFFDKYALTHQSHSSSSWRDRYRKFARNHGLQQYCRDYEAAKDTKEGPQPMRHMTSRASKAEKKNENEVKRIKKSHVENVALAAIQTNQHGTGLHQSTHLDHMNARGSASVPELMLGSREHAALEEEIGSVKNQHIDDALQTAAAGRVNIEEDMVNAIHPNLTGRGVEAENDDFGVMALKEADSQDFRELDYLPRSATLDDIFTPEFYRHDSKKLLERVKDVLLRGDPLESEKVYDEFEHLGMTKKFVSHCLRVSGGISMYLLQFLSMMLKHIEEDKGARLDEALFIDNINGLWTPEAEEALINGHYDRLSYMSQDMIAMRQEFLGLNG